MKEAPAQKANNIVTESTGTAVRLDYFTDPLCCWSWAMQPHLDKLLQAYGSKITIRYYMCGLIESWSRYNDSINVVSTPTQMGPQWVYAAANTKAEIAAGIWVNDPPASSYPACIAVKCAQLQGQEAGEQYLKKIRQMVMTRELNIAREKVLLLAADELTKENKIPFDADLFYADWKEERGVEAFKQDLAQKHQLGITRMPTLLFTCNGKTTGLLGYQTLDGLMEAACYITRVENGTQK